MLLCVCPSISPILGAAVLPYDVTSLMDHKRVVDFSVQLFTCCYDRMVNSELLTCQTKNQNLEIFLFLLVTVDFKCGKIKK